MTDGTGTGTGTSCFKHRRKLKADKVCDECNYGSYQGCCVICGGPGVSNTYYCKECTIMEKNVSWKNCQCHSEPVHLFKKRWTNLVSSDHHYLWRWPPFLLKLSDMTSWEFAKIMIRYNSIPINLPFSWQKMYNMQQNCLDFYPKVL